MSQLQCSLNKEKSNFQNLLITATEEQRKIFDCNIVNNNFSVFFNDESTPSKDAINMGNRHIDKKEI